MNPVLKKAFLATSLLSSVMLLGSGGCSKKNVVTTDTEGAASGADFSGGTNIDYPEADGLYSERGLSDPESLESGGQVIGKLSINSADAQEQSEEYKRTYGRSSTVFSPVYFDFDQAGVKAEMKPIITSNANYMKDSLDTVIVIEGNCDERGTNEYNLALGERRAINVKEYMVNLGVEPGRIRTVSYGEERPLFMGQNDLDWAMNRRADFIVE